MTFSSGNRLDTSNVRRGGRGRGGLAIGGGIGGLVVLVAALFLGIDPTQLGLTGEEPAGRDPAAGTLDHCRTGADANADVECRMVGAANSLDDYWRQAVPADGGRYAVADVVLFTGSVQTACGGATSAVGPFYCPADTTIYLDTGFFDELTTQFGGSGGPFAQLYVMAHEYGHHVQNLTGTLGSAQRGGSGPESDSVRVELQADCYAGLWAQHAASTPDESGTPLLEPLTDEQIAQALSAASAIGDDRIQEQATGQVNPEAWTHGSAEQRQRWFTTGYTATSSAACDTFAAAQL